MGICWAIVGQYIERRNLFWYVPQFMVIVYCFGHSKDTLGPTGFWQIRWTNSDASLNQLIQAYQAGEMNKDSNLRHCRRALQMVELDELPFFHRYMEIESNPQ